MKTEQMPETESQPGPKREEYSLKSLIREAAYSILEQVKEAGGAEPDPEKPIISRIVFRDVQGHTCVYALSQAEAAGVERAIWSAGESSFSQDLEREILTYARAHGIDIDHDYTVSVDPDIYDPSQHRPRAAA